VLGSVPDQASIFREVTLIELKEVLRPWGKGVPATRRDNVR
jgi:hypothetical protein